MSAKKFTGKVVSNKMSKVCVVAVEMPKRHPIYDKIVKNTRKFKARTDRELGIGTVVVIEECAPFSSTGSFQVVEVVGEGKE